MQDDSCRKTSPCGSCRIALLQCMDGTRRLPIKPSMRCGLILYSTTVIIVTLTVLSFYLPAMLYQVITQRLFPTHPCRHVPTRSPPMTGSGI